jgi:hypothetical protein
VARKLSRRFATSGPIEKADEVRRSRLLVLRETWLPPGRYTVETAVQDAASGRLGVQRAPLELPSTESALRVSSLVVVGHAAPRGEAPPEAPSLVTQGIQIYPSAGSLGKGDDRSLTGPGCGGRGSSGLLVGGEA